MSDKMPFKSDAQRRWMHSQKPKMAKKWEEHTPENAKLPEKVSVKQAGYNAALSRLGIQ